MRPSFIMVIRHVVCYTELINIIFTSKYDYCRKEVHVPNRRVYLIFSQLSSVIKTIAIGGFVRYCPIHLYERRDMGKIKIDINFTQYLSKQYLYLYAIPTDLDTFEAVFVM